MTNRQYEKIRNQQIPAAIAAADAAAPRPSDEAVSRQSPEYLEWCDTWNRLYFMAMNTLTRRAILEERAARLRCELERIEAELAGRLAA